jgi:hypothetical protein
LLNLQEICSRLAPSAAESLGFSISRAANLQRICSKNLLQIHSKRAMRCLMLAWHRDVPLAAKAGDANYQHGSFIAHSRYIVNIIISILNDHAVAAAPIRRCSRPDHPAEN